MADLKIKIKKTLVAGDKVYTAGQVFEGTLDTFPEDIRITYLQERWDLIEILVTPKGVSVAKKFEPPTVGEQMKIQPLFDKNKVESVSAVPGTPITDLPSTEMKTAKEIVKKKHSTKKGQLVPSTISSEPISAQAEEGEFEGTASNESEAVIKPVKKKLLKPKKK